MNEPRFDPSQLRPLAEPSRLPRYVGLVAVILFSAGIGVGWLVFSDKSSSPTEQEPQPRGWSLTPVPIEGICSADEGQLAAGIAPNRGSPAPLRLSDHMPDVSPVDDLKRAYDGPIDAPDLPDANVASGFLEGYARTFVHPEKPGGFTVYAYRFPSSPHALGALLVELTEDVCRFDADPFRVDEQTGMFIARQAAEGSNSSTWWVHGHDLIQVSYSMWKDPDKDFRSLIEVTEDVWELGDVEGPTLS